MTMSIYIDDAIPEVDAAQDAESYEWLWNDSPVYARAVEAAIRNGRTPQQIRERFLRRGYGMRPERAARTDSYTNLRAHETPEQLVCRYLPKKKKQNKSTERK